MKIHKMPKNYMICDCGCEFEFNGTEIIIEEITLTKQQLKKESIVWSNSPYVTCPFCKKDINISKAIENPQSQKNSNDEIATQLSNLKLELKIEELQNIIITNIEAMTDKKCANKMREWKKEYDNNISKIMKDCEEYIANRLTIASE